MEFLKSITIKNYRGIRNISFKPKSLNIIIGPNNTGKSAILESIGLLLSSHKSFRDYSDRNILEYLLEEKEYNPKYLININSKYAEISGIIGNKKVVLNIEYYNKGLPEDIRENIILEYFEKIAKKITKEYINETQILEYRTLKRILDLYIKQLASATNLNIDIAKQVKDEVLKMLKRKRLRIKEAENAETQINVLTNNIKKRMLQELYDIPKIVLTIYSEEKDIIGLYLYLMESLSIFVPLPLERINRLSVYFKYHKYLPEGIHEIALEKEQMKFIPPVIFNFRKIARTSFVENLHDIIVSRGRIDKVITLIKEQIPYIEDIRKTDTGLFIFTTQYSKPVPLSSMGEGFISLLKISFILSLIDYGIFVLEEPEVLLHPKYIDLISEELISKINDSQFFISTHSLDLLQSVLNIAEKYGKLEEIAVIRLHYREDINDVVHEVLSGYEAKDEIDEIGTDLRIT